MKGIFYSIITAVLIAPVVLATFVYLNSLETRSGTLQVKALGDRLASFSASMNDDLPRATIIIAKNAIQFSITQIDLTGQPLDDANQRLAILMKNGTFYGNTTPQNFTYDSWVAQLKQKGELYGFATNVSLLDLNMTQLDSYTAGVNIRMLVNLTDKSGKMGLERTYIRTIEFSIEGFADPLYTLKTSGVLKRVITAPNETVHDVATLDRAVAGGSYMPSDGPTFLDRLEGRLTRSLQYPAGTGLETIVYLSDFQANGLAANSAASDVDYLYFSGASGCPVDGSGYGWLKLDDSHAAGYSVTVTC